MWGFNLVRLAFLPLITPTTLHFLLWNSPWFPLVLNCRENRSLKRGLISDLAIAVQLKFFDEQSQELVEQANLIASSALQKALENEVVTELLVHYVNILAPWYDLNDCQLNFARLVPLHALNNPILFKALIAFSASHRNKVQGTTSVFASAFHSSCVSELLQHLEKNGSDIEGDCLAATCLLRSYEILNGDSRKEQRHLLGAYSFVISDSINLRDCGLPQAGA